MQQLSDAIKIEYAEFAAKTKAEGGFVKTQIAQGATPPEAALLKRVPYAMGTELYSAEDMGLIRVDNYLGIEKGDDGDDGGDEEGDDSKGDTEEGETRSARAAAQRALVINKPCHTEFGDGIIVGAAALGKNSPDVTRIHVRMNDGTLVRSLHATNVFIITRTETNGIDMRNLLAKAAGLTPTAEITVPGMTQKDAKVTKKSIREEERRKREIEDTRKEKDKKERGEAKISIGLELEVVNGYLKLTYVPGVNTKYAKILQAQGFKSDPQYYFTQVKTAKQLLTQVKNWAEAGFDADSRMSKEALSLLTGEMASGGLRTHRHYAKLTGSAAFRNFYRATFKPLADKKMLQIFTLVTDGGDKDAAAIRELKRSGAQPNFGVAYLCLPYGGGHPASKAAINGKYKAPNTRWFINSPSVSVFVSNLTGVRKVLMNLIDAGIKVNNLKELSADAKRIRRLPALKNDESIDLHVKDVIGQKG